MTLCQIAAMSQNRVIGIKNKLPWHIPEDLKFFREKTKGHIIIMGRKTFESVGSQPLPQRLNLIVSRQADLSSKELKNVRFFFSIDEAIEFAKSQASQWGDEIYICGGGEIYRQTMSVVDRIYLTVIHSDFDGDSFFPEIDMKKFKEVDRKDLADSVSFSFVVYDRI